MNRPDSSAPEWQPLGELELTLQTEADSQIGTWLAGLFAPLELPAEFAARVLGSAQDAARRAMHSNRSVLDAGHIHLLILIPADPGSKGRTWGFFRIEKMEGTGKAPRSDDHSIEFYLYTESQPAG